MGDDEDSPDGDVVGSLLLFSYSLADFFSLISLCRWIINGMLLIELFTAVYLDVIVMGEL